MFPDYRSKIEYIGNSTFTMGLFISGKGFWLVNDVRRQRHGQS